MSTKRVGRFEISRKLIDTQPTMALLMLSGMLVVRAEIHHYGDYIEYLAYSDEFDRIEQCGCAPTYTAQFREESLEDGMKIEIFECWKRE